MNHEINQILLTENLTGLAELSLGDKRKSGK